MKKIICLMFTGFLCVGAVRAGEPSIWSINSRTAVLKGDSKGVSISDTGSITLAPKLNEIYKTEQPFIWSSAVDSDGNVYLGTGGNGRIFKVDSNGKGKLFHDTSELNVSALAIGENGVVYAGTSPDGKVYRISKNGNASVYFEPKEKYIWSLAIMKDGSLAIGTGEHGKIYRVTSANAKPEASVFFDTSETHIISMTTDADGNLYAGTDSNGLVIRFSPDGKPFALLDSSLREIHEISVGKDGSVYVLALSESASTKKPDVGDTKKNKSETVSVGGKKPGAIQIPPPTKSRYDLTSAKSVVYRILPGGGDDVIWSSDKIVAFSILANPKGDGVLIGTSDKGRIYSVSNSARETLLLQSTEEQISTMLLQKNRILATSSSSGKLFGFSRAATNQGSYESPVLDAKAVALWGRIWWQANGNVQIQTRSGNTEKPAETWSNWSAPYANQRGGQISSPKTKYIQWRAILKNSGVAARLNEVNLSFLARNISPEVLSIKVLPTNVGFKANPKLPVNPNIKTLGLDPKNFGIIIPPIIPRKVYQQGAKSLSWKAEDRNGDELRYAIYYRTVNESKFRLLRDGISENFITIDGLVLADGRYIFKVIANDSPSNPPSQVLSAERTSEPFDIDNTAPLINLVGTPQINGDNIRVVFEAVEASGYIKRAEYSLDGKEWKTVYSDDGISDGSREKYTVELTLRELGKHSITLRVFDSSANIGHARVVINK